LGIRPILVVRQLRHYNDCALLIGLTARNHAVIMIGCGATEAVKGERLIREHMYGTVTL